MYQDIRFAIRQLGKSPVFTAIVLITLTLSIGAGTLVYSAIQGVLLKPLEGREPDRLVTIRSTKGEDEKDQRTSAPDYRDWVERNTSFTDLSASNFTTFNLTGEGEAMRAAGLRITSNFYHVLGLSPVLGRTFRPEEEIVGNNRVAILSYPIWQSVFGGDPSVVGRTIMLSEMPHLVVGVGPKDMDQVGDRSWRPEIMVPLAYEEAPILERRELALLNIQARLKPGVSIAQAQAEMDAIAAHLAEQYPDTNKGRGVVLVRTDEYLTQSIRPVLWSLLGAVGCLLLIACANVANLLLARATVRQKEMSLRAALGAAPWRLMRQLLTESLLLSVLGGIGGVLLAAWGLELLKAYPATGELVRLAKVELNPAIMGFSLGLSLLTGLVFGVAPSWFASRVGLNEALKQGTRGSTGSGSLARMRNGLVVFEVACALVMLSCSGLLLHSFMKLTEVDPGFKPEGAAFAQVFLRGGEYSVGMRPNEEPIRAFTDAVLERLSVLPGVEVAASGSLPMIIYLRPFPFRLENQPTMSLNEMPTTQVLNGSPEYFQAMGIRLVRGRFFTAFDGSDSQAVVINESLARMNFPGEDPIGKRLSFSFGDQEPTWTEIVGVVSDVVPELGQTRQAQTYFPLATGSSTVVNFIVRTNVEPSSLLDAIKREIHAVDSNIPVVDSRPLSEVMAESIALQRFAFHLLGMFAVIALVVAAVGIYGLMAYTVSQRTTEFGIRMALGARTADVLRLVLSGGARLVGIGLLLGLVGAMVSGRLIQAQLYETRPNEPLVLAGITLFFTMVALFACWVPARRATRVDPMVALRND